MSLPSNMWIAVRFFLLFIVFKSLPHTKSCSLHIIFVPFAILYETSPLIIIWIWRISIYRQINALSVKHNFLSLLFNSKKDKIRNTPIWLVKFVFRFYTTMVLTECLINIEINSFPLLKKDFEHMLKDELYHSCCSLNLLQGPEPATERDNVQFPNIKERVSRFPRNLHPCLHCFFHDKIWLPRDLLKIIICGIRASWCRPGWGGSGSTGRSRARRWWPRSRKNI